MFDLSPEGFDAQVYITVDENGVFYAEAEIFGVDYHVHGVVVEDGNVFTIGVPEFGLGLRFFIQDNQFIVFDDEFNELLLILEEWLEYEFAAPAVVTAPVVTAPVVTAPVVVAPAAVPPISSLAGRYVFDLSPIGFDLVIRLSVSPEGIVYGESEVDGEHYHVNAFINEVGGVFSVIDPVLNVRLRFIIEGDDIIAFDEDFTALEALLLELFFE
jgi:hypothetical protein